MPAPVPVLLYHSISDAPTDYIADFAIGPKAFSEQIDAVASSGREAVTLGELAARLNSDDPSSAENVVCVTFDDGWHDNLDAAETLAAAGVPATIYVTSGYVGEPDMVNNAELSQLADAPGIEIGAHTVTHPHLDELRIDQARAEIANSKSAVEQLIGRDVNTFAYPHGAYNRAVRELVVDAGFTSAASVKNAISHTADDSFAIARWTITSGSTTDEVRSILDGTGAPLAWRRERLRTTGFRVVRRFRNRAARRSNK